jgi:uncharacterized protein YdaU (DUF1376 family)
MASQEAGGVIMKTARLDWMKFYVYDFMCCEDVMMMTAEEVGQYCLLLFTAWLGGKDCTLPNDRKFLERAARGSASSLVLSKFKEENGRLVNEAQREIWNEGKELWQAASEAGKRGNEKRWHKKDSRDDCPPIPTQSGADRELNRCDVMEEEKNSNVAIALGKGNHIPSSNFPSTNNGNGQQATASVLPAPSLSTPKNAPPPSLYDDLEFETLPKENKLARYFHHDLPQSNKDAAPHKWEMLWATDLAVLKDDFNVIADVMDYAAGKVDSKTKERIYVRMSAFVKNYDSLKVQWKKINKAKKPNGKAGLSDEQLEAMDAVVEGNAIRKESSKAPLPQPAELMTPKEKTLACTHGDGQWSKNLCPLCQ